MTPKLHSRLRAIVVFVTQWALYIAVAILYVGVTQAVARAVPDSGFWPGYFGIYLQQLQESHWAFQQD